MRWAALVALIALAACESARVDPLDEYAAASCAAIQEWIDAVEDYATELSRAVTPLLDRSSERVEHYRRFARSIRERTDDTVRHLKRIAPAAGAGRVVADRLVEAMEGSRTVTEELIELADSFPDGDDDREDTTSRISSILVRLEKAFTWPATARRELADRHPVFDRTPACVDYADPVS